MCHLCYNDYVLVAWVNPSSYVLLEFFAIQWTGLGGPGIYVHITDYLAACALFDIEPQIDAIESLNDFFTVNECPVKLALEQEKAVMSNLQPARSLRQLLRELELLKWVAV